MEKQIMKLLKNNTLEECLIEIPKVYPQASVRVITNAWEVMHHVVDNSIDKSKEQE